MQIKSSAQAKKGHGHRGLLSRPVVRVVSVWAWVIVGPLLVAGVVLLLLHTDLATARQAFGTHPYLAAYFELLSAGLLPVVFSLICRDDPSWYGLRRAGFVKSLILSALVVAASYAFSFLGTGQVINVAFLASRPPFPWTIWYALLGIFTYGPLEVFFVIWLMANTGRMFKSKRVGISWGLTVTVLLFGLLHVLVTQSIPNALDVAVTFSLFGLIYVYTGNSIGPMIAWTLINGQVWFLAQLLWS